MMMMMMIVVMITDTRIYLCTEEENYSKTSHEELLYSQTCVKAGVNLKAVSMPLKIGLMEISRSRFKQSKSSLLIP